MDPARLKRLIFGPLFWLFFCLKFRFIAPYAAQNLFQKKKKTSNLLEETGPPGSAFLSSSNWNLTTA